MTSLFIRRIGAIAGRILPVVFARRFRGSDTLSIICMMRDEGRYLGEWIEYHKLVGVDRFYLFDNESSDETKEILQPYIDSGLVVYEYASDARLLRLRRKYRAVGEKAQVGHWLGVNKCRNKTKWAAMIDVDEFLVPKTDPDMPSFLARFGNGVQQVIVGWNIFGSSGHKAKPDGLVIKSYTRRGDARRGMDPINNFKSIVNPRRILVDCNHYHIISGKTVDENGRRVVMWRDNGRRFPTELCAINHYIVRSYEECREKIKKNKSIHFFRYDDGYFNKYDVNDVEDLSIQRFADRLVLRDPIISGKGRPGELKIANE